MVRTRTISFTVKRKTGDTLDAVLQFMINDGQPLVASEQSETGQDRSILYHAHAADELEWDFPVRIVSSGDYSEVIITLSKPEWLSETQFEQRANEIAESVRRMKDIIDS